MKLKLIHVVMFFIILFVPNKSYAQINNIFDYHRIISSAESELINDNINGAIQFYEDALMSSNFEQGKDWANLAILYFHQNSKKQGIMAVNKSIELGFSIERLKSSKYLKKQIRKSKLDINGEVVSKEDILFFNELLKKDQEIRSQSDELLEYGDSVNLNALFNWIETHGIPRENQCLDINLKNKRTEMFPIYLLVLYHNSPNLTDKQLLILKSKMLLGELNPIIYASIIERRSLNKLGKRPYLIAHSNNCNKRVTILGDEVKVTSKNIKEANSLRKEIGLVSLDETCKLFNVRLKYNLFSYISFGI